MHIYVFRVTSNESYAFSEVAPCAQRANAADAKQAYCIAEAAHAALTLMS